jgi:hypothetical protein
MVKKPDPTAARRARTLNKQRRWAEEMRGDGWIALEPKTGPRLIVIHNRDEVLLDLAPAGMTCGAEESGFICARHRGHRGEHQSSSNGMIAQSWLER